MWTYDKALAIVRAYVDNATDGRGVVLEGDTWERPYGWVFFYRDREYLEAGDVRHALAGNTPIIFNCLSGEYHVTGTAHPLEQYLREYEAALPAVVLEIAPEPRKSTGAG